MRIEFFERQCWGGSAWRQIRLRGIGLLACGGIGIGAVSLLQAHSDPRMFGQSVVAAPAVVVSEVNLPPKVMGREQSLFGLTSVQTGLQASAIKTYGVVVPNSQAMIDVNIAVSGQVAEVFVRVGERVRKGQPIASVFNPEFITTQKGYLEFLKNEDKLEVLREEGRLPNYLRDAKENLRWWGLNDKQITGLIDHGKVVEHIMLDAPTDGFITELFIQPGSLVNAGDKTMKQFVVVGRAVARMVDANASLWVEGYIFPDQRALLQPGLPVRISLPEGGQLERPIAQVMPVVDPVTQRARFLVDLGKAPASIAVGQNVNVSLQMGSRSGTWVSRQAILGQGVAPAVYVQAAPGRYLRKPVVVLDETTDLCQVQGVEAGEKVVVAGKMMLEGLYRISAGAGANAGGHDHADHHH